jgi:eukaryotic-like serine/threonine-protein kinase
MLTTTFREGALTASLNGQPARRCPDELMARYQTLLEQERLSWTEHHRLIRQLGAGGQGVVYLSERRGTDGFSIPVALKVFSPERYDDEAAYDAAMGRIAQVAALIARIQQDNLLDVHNWVENHRIRLMEMEWVDGFDLGRLLTRTMLDWLYQRASAKRWSAVNEVVVTLGDSKAQPRLKPGIAIAIIRDCLAALAALHREGVVHGDVKPSNIMLRVTGTAKLVDMGSAFPLNDVPPQRACTPVYAAPEVLENEDGSPQSDLASLGYVLIEMLSGAPVFQECTNLRELLEAKRSLLQRLPKLLPHEVTVNDLLMSFLRRLIAPDPTCRFRSAEDADLDRDGAAGFLRQLVKGNLASEYHNEIRLWLRDLDGMTG